MYFNQRTFFKFLNVQMFLLNSFSRWRVSMEHTWQMSTLEICWPAAKNLGLWLHLTREESGSLWRLQGWTIMVTLQTVNQWVMLRNFTNNWRSLNKKDVQLYIAFWADVHYLPDQADFWQSGLFGHEKRCSVIILFFVDLHFIFEK